MPEYRIDADPEEEEIFCVKSGIAGTETEQSLIAIWW